MSMNQEVVTIVTPIGEIVGRLKEETCTHVVLTNPRMFVTQQGGEGFAPGVCMTGQRDPAELEFNKDTIVVMTLTQEDVAKGWQEATSSIVLTS